MKTRHPRQIRRDLRNYLKMMATLREMRAYDHIAVYERHVAAMERELELVRS